MKRHEAGPAGDFFAPRRQFARVLAADWRGYRTDFLYGVFYALIGFLLMPQEGRAHAEAGLFAPFITLSVAVGFMAYRVCAAERAPQTADLYFNLPRSRAVAWAAHVALLGAVALALESLILLAAAARFNLPAAAAGYRVTPQLLAWPLLTLAMAVWAVYLLPNWIWRVGLFLPVFVLYPFLVVRNYIIHPASPAETGHEFYVTAGLLALAGLLLVHCRRAWLKKQIGAR